MRDIALALARRSWAIGAGPWILSHLRKRYRDRSRYRLHKRRSSAAGGFLHGDAFSVGAFAECQLLAVGEAKGHSHSEWYQFDTAPIWTRSDLSK